MAGSPLPPTGGPGQPMPDTGDFNPPGPGNAITLFEFGAEFLAKLSIKTTIYVVSIVPLFAPNKQAKSPFLVKLKYGAPAGIVLTELLVSDMSSEGDAEEMIRRTIERHNQFTQNRDRLAFQMPMWDADP